MKTMSRRSIKTSVLALLVAGTAAFAAACSGDNSPTAPSSGGGSGSGGGGGTSPNAAVAGTYRLMTVNGHPVPGPFDSFSPIPSQTMRMEARSGRIIMNSDGTFTHERETALTGTNVPNPVVSKIGYDGKYTMQNGTLTMTPTGGTSLKVVYTTGQIEIYTTAPALNGRDDTFAWTYRK